MEDRGQAAGFAAVAAHGPADAGAAGFPGPGCSPRLRAFSLAACSATRAKSTPDGVVGAVPAGGRGALLGSVLVVGEAVQQDAGGAGQPVLGLVTGGADPSTVVNHTGKRERLATASDWRPRKAKVRRFSARAPASMAGW